VCLACGSPGQFCCDIETDGVGRCRQQWTYCGMGGGPDQAFGCIRCGSQGLLACIQGSPSPRCDQGWREVEQHCVCVTCTSSSCGGPGQLACTAGSGKPPCQEKYYELMGFCAYSYFE
jgi:hypothetical protein